MSWAENLKFNNIYIPPQIEKKEEGIDWLELVEEVKRECKIKTKPTEVEYSEEYYRARHRFCNNKTETLNK